MAAASRSGTIITLVLLVASMSIGAYLLILMETEPAIPSGPAPLWAGSSGRSNPELSLIRRTNTPLQSIKWANIVVHHAACGRGRAVGGCHFVIGAGGKYADGRILATRRWDRQQDGDHVRVPGFDFNANSIGVCLQAPPGRGGPTAKQAKMLVRLVRALQVTFAIPRDHVYLHSDLGEADCPGGGFEAGGFRRKLVSALP